MFVSLRLQLSFGCIFEGRCKDQMTCSAFTFSPLLSVVHIEENINALFFFNCENGVFRKTSPPDSNTRWVTFLSSAFSCRLLLFCACIFPFLLFETLEGVKPQQMTAISPLHTVFIRWHAFPQRSSGVSSHHFLLWGAGVNTSSQTVQESPAPYHQLWPLESVILAVLTDYFSPFVDVWKILCGEENYVSSLQRQTTGRLLSAERRTPHKSVRLSTPLFVHHLTCYLVLHLSVGRAVKTEGGVTLWRCRWKSNSESMLTGSPAAGCCLLVLFFHI